MTASLGSHPGDNEGQKLDGRTPDDQASGHQDAGTALEPSLGAGEDIALAPFLSASRADAGSDAPRPLLSKLLDYSAHAAMIVGLLGFAWTISEHVGRRQPEPQPAKVVQAPVAPPVDETAELRRTNQKMAADIGALRLSLDSLRAAMRQDKTVEQMHALSASVDGVKTGLNATKSETSAALAQLASKIDHLPHAEALAKVQQIAERLDKMERANADMTTTASLAPASAAPAAIKATPVALPPVRPQTPVKPPLAAESDATKKPQVLADWVVRDVYDGVAVVEGKRGPMEVVPGVTIPGAGVVKSIERHGAGWTVTTSKGLLAYAPPPPRERAPRDFYRPGPGPEDF